MKCKFVPFFTEEKIYKMGFSIFLSIQVLVLVLRPTYCQQNEIADMRFATQGNEITLPCAVPNDATFLKWKFIKNGTDKIIDAAQVYPGNIKSVFIPFDSPPGRSELNLGNFIIHKVEVRDEGHYWCEITNPGATTAYSTRYPVHVYVTPLKPQVTSLSNNTLTEHKNVTVARCSSQGGKPGSKLVWMNGSTPMSSASDLVYQENAFSSDLTDAFLDLLITNPTRYDHKRNFSCVIDHPAYDGEKKTLNYTILVKYHPINARIWANLTSLYIFCEAESYPAATYSWKIPGGVSGFKKSSLYIQDLYDMPGHEYFECTASNGIPPNATVRVKADALRYPDGNPGWLGLEWWVWGAIFGGIVGLVLLIVLIIYCVRKRKAEAYDKPVKYTKPQKNSTKPYSVPVDSSYRRPDGREDSFDSRTPSPMNEHKRALIGGAFDNRHSQGSITLVPSGDLRRSRENMYEDDTMHASREQLDQVASHIQTLNKSWDHLSKSRQQLNEAQDELQGNSPALHKSREQLYHSREALNRDTDQNYPYIDEGTTRSNEYYPQYDDRYTEEQDGYRKEDPPSYDYGEQNYNTNQNYNGYDTGNQRYDYNNQGGYDDRYQDSNIRGDHGGYAQDRDNRYSDRQGYGYRDGQYR